MSSTSLGQIVAIGGGRQPRDPAASALLDDFLLSLVRRSPARVCFIPTASGDSAPYIVQFYRAFGGRCIASDLTLSDSPVLPRRPASTRELAAFVAEQDLFYV